MKRVLFLACLLFVTGTSRVWGQDNDIFSSYGVDDGLPQSTVWSIIQDRNGFLWIGTSDGVCRFDGYNFTIYRNDPNDTSSVVGGLYSRFYKDSTGALWVISQNGICLYNDVKDNFTTIFSLKIEHPSPDYNCIYGEDAQFIWAGMSDSGLIKIDKRTHKVISLQNLGYTHFSPFASWQSGFISNGKIWTSGSNVDCYVFDMKTGALDKTNVPHLYKIVDFNDSEVLAATQNSLIIFDKRTLKHKVLPLNTSEHNEGGVTDIFVASPSTVILCSPRGLFYLDAGTWKIRKVIQSFARGQKRSYTYVQCIYRDNSGNLWIGTNGDGLKKITAPFKRFKYYSSFNETGNLAKSIYADRRNIYVGYFDNGLEIFSREKGFIKSVSMMPLHSTQNHVYALAALDSNNLILNLVNGEFLYKYPLDGSRPVPFSPIVASILPGYKSLPGGYPFLLRSKNIIYTIIGSCLVGFDVADPAHIRPFIVHRFPKDFLICSFTDSKDMVWVGTQNGAFYISNGVANKIKLPGDVLVKSINEDLKGNIWLGTVKGIYVVDSTKNVVRYYSENNGLVNRFIYGLLRDDDGNMWFSHNKGLSVYNTSTNTFRHYTKEDGLQSNEFNTGAYFKSDDGELFFGGINGVNSFNPRDVRDNPFKPNVVITSIKIFDLPLKSDSAYWNIRSLRLPYTQNSLSFEFAGIEYTNPEKNQYAYMMEGLDNSWINVGDRRFARYAALPPGRYTFKVKASNNDGIWQDKPTTVIITIIPPFWQQLWFRVLVVSFSLGVMAIVILLIQRQRHKRQMRVIELQQKIQMERERISRDLHDNVGTQLSLISNNIEWVEHPLKVISEDEKADKLHFVNQTARGIIATLRETIWALNKEQISLEEFTDKLKAFTQKQLSIYPGIELKFAEQMSEGVVLGPSEALNLFRICQEAIANALKYSGAKLITIDIKSASDKYSVVISDNGGGFNMESVDPAVHNGLENMKYRAKDIDCTLEISSETGRGTIVKIVKI